MRNTTMTITALALAAVLAGCDNADINIDMVFVEGGTFTMGCPEEYGEYCDYDYDLAPSPAYADGGDDSDDDDKIFGHNCTSKHICDSDEYPAHSVTVSSYYMGMYEISQDIWIKVMGSNPSNFDGNNNLPVECVSWYDIQKFIKKLNRKTGKKYRLPTEAEWEYAARGGNRSKGYMYSGSDDLDEVAWYHDRSLDSMVPPHRNHPVGTKAPNELGIHDMSGNVWEWVNDFWGYYDSTAKINPRGQLKVQEPLRVIRGGGSIASSCRVSTRHSAPSIETSYALGFRLAHNAD